MAVQRIRQGRYSAPGSIVVLVGYLGQLGKGKWQSQKKNGHVDLGLPRFACSSKRSASNRHGGHRRTRPKATRSQ